MTLDNRLATHLTPTPASTERGAPPGAPPAADRPGRAWPTRLAAHPVLAALVAAAVLHLLWWWLLANSGGDIAAQDAWAEFARTHPDSAYNLAWYGGIHPVSYSVLSPYLMAVIGVRTTMVLAGTFSAALLALVLVRSKAIERPLWPALYGALALAGNAVSGRVTFGLGTLFALGAVAVVYAWPQRWRSTKLRHRLPRALLVAMLAALATASSPVAGLFLGVAAAALWLGRRRPAAYAIGLPPVAVVVLSAWLFPFSGQQPMGWTSTILPVIVGLTVLLLTPVGWRSVHLGAAVYIAAVFMAWLVPSPIGTNVTRLGLLFGGVVLVAAACCTRPVRRPAERWVPPAVATILLVAAIATSSIWQIATAANDAIQTDPPDAWSLDTQPLIDQLEARDAGLARVEVVPSRSHREAAALAPYANLARGWNRQADAERNQLFYGDDPLTPGSYRTWLDRWAVHYVVLPTGKPDGAAVEEAALVAGGLSYLHQVWANASWRLYELRSPTPLADHPAVVTRFDAAEVDIFMPRPGIVRVRIPDSPWLSLVDADGKPVEPPTSLEPGAPPVNLNGCLSEQPPSDIPGATDDDWTLLHAPSPGIYRIAAPYKIPRGTTCPDE